MAVNRNMTPFDRRASPIRWIGTALSALVPAAGLLSVPILAEPSPDFSAVVSQMRDRTTAGVPSIAIAVARHGRVIWEHAEGISDREGKIKATVHTPYYLASVSKTITATALMALVERKKVDLNQPVNRYLRTAKLSSPLWDVSQATVWRVANHTAGLATYDRGCREDDSKCDPSPTSAIRRYGVVVWPPGKYFDYSNLDYGILGEAVAQVSGVDLGRSLRRLVFEPLGMTDCSLGPRADRKNPPAARYDQAPPFVRRPPGLSTTPGASALYCSVHDLATFGMFHLKDHLSSQKQLLSDRTIELMQANSLDPKEQSQYGLGWWVQPDLHGFRGVQAQGGTSDATAYVQLIPSEDIAVAMLWNAGTPDGAELIDQVLSAILPQYRENLGHPKQADSQRRALVEPKTPTGMIGAWIGFVQTDLGRVPLTVTIDGSGGLVAKLGSEPEVQAHPTLFGGALRWNMPGFLGVEGDPLDLAMRLYLYDNVLAGAARTSPSPSGRQGPLVYYWVQAEKGANMVW